jgi:hypothetical protein
MTKKMDTEFTHIQMVDATRANGAMENNMERECL